jgi:hypothetical protein
VVIILAAADSGTSLPIGKALKVTRPSPRCASKGRRHEAQRQEKPDEKGCRYPRARSGRALGRGSVRFRRPGGNASGTTATAGFHAPGTASLDAPRGTGFHAPGTAGFDAPGFHAPRLAAEPQLPASGPVGREYRGRQ